MNYEIWLFPFLIVLIWGANSSACSEPLSCEQCKPHQPIEQIFFNENLIDIFFTHHYYDSDDFPHLFYCAQFSYNIWRWIIFVS